MLKELPEAEKDIRPSYYAGELRQPADNNKKAAVIAMMNRARGATLPEIMKATAWQAHTVRGFISILGSKGGHSIESTKNAAGARTYCIVR
jgi:Protein of unknown function (DUF3489)